MYYLKIQDEDGVIGNTLIYYCRNCGHEDKTLSTTNICVSDIQLRSSEKKYTHIVNEYTKYDPTLPRINTIKCPNQDCLSNGQGGGGAGKEGTTKIKIARTKKATATDMKTVEQAAEKATQASEKAQASLALAEANLATIMAEEQAEQDQVEEQEQEQEQLAEGQTPANNREVIYIRYDDINMKYVYLCVHCDTTWRTDNRL
jgi:DNA-directed RNA polymerase subunit M/transcription elongation factor TFIIS